MPSGYFFSAQRTDCYDANAPSLESLGLFFFTQQPAASGNTWGFSQLSPNRTNSWVANTVTVNDNNNNNNTTTRINLSRATGDARDGGKKIKTTSASGTLSSSTRCWFLRTRHKRQHPVPVDDRA